MDQRISKYEKQATKLLLDQQEKVEIIKLTQNKTIEECQKLHKELSKKKESHQLQVEAWDREYQLVMREQAISVMIKDSYEKEIARV